MALNPSKYQQAVFNWVASATKGQTLIISAVPGSGKTTTIVEASKLCSSESKVFLAFNKAIATELGRKMPDTECSTLHSLGYKTLAKALKGKRIKVDGLKYHKILKDLMSPSDYYDFGTDVVRLLELAQCNLVKASDPMLSSTYNLNPDVYDYVNEIDEALRIGITKAKNLGSITFNDMIWLVDRLKLQPERYEWAFIDESQDLNAMQISMVKKLADTNVFVGDENQSIYGFAGAMDDSMQRIAEAFQAEKLPLSICYRCPKSHIDYANGVFDTMEPRPRAPKGVLEDLTYSVFLDKVSSGDLVLSRVTAPLVQTCFALLSQGKGAYVAGRDIEASFIAILKKMEKIDRNYSNFSQTLESYEVVMSEKIQSDKGLQNLRDKLDALRCCYMASVQSQSYDQLKEEISKLFAEKKNCTKLSTIHRAKGLEADRVFVFTHKLPLSFKGQRSWEVKQEDNLQYVAFTRSRKELYLVDNAIDE